MKSNIAPRRMRLAINLLRSAESDFLNPKSDPEDRATAKSLLFGLDSSPLPQVCRALGIDPDAARLLILQWKSQGRVGDPIFSYLSESGNLKKVRHGIKLNVPGFKDLRPKCKN
jgi:hypothetical protein